MKRIPPWIVLLSFVSLLLMVYSYLDFDRSLALWINSSLEPFKRLSKVLSLMLSPESNLIFWPTAYFIADIYLAKKSYAPKLLFILISIANANFITAGIKLFAGRARPYELIQKDLFGFYPFSTGDGFHSFPSGHATTAFALSTALSFLFPRFRYPLFLLAFILSLSRVMLLDHFVSDLLGSALISLWITTFTYKKLEKKLTFV